jgi:hypothetical protein
MNKSDYTKETKYTWLDMEKIIEELAKKILVDFQPEVIVVVAMGGWIPARLLRNYIKAEYLSIGCKSCDEEDNTLGQAEFYQNIDQAMIVGKKVLILDEVCETGITMAEVTKKIKAMNPAVLKTAIIHQKAKAKFVPDYYIRLVENEWIIYPWNI